VRICLDPNLNFTGFEFLECKAAFGVGQSFETSSRQRHARGNDGLACAALQELPTESSVSRWTLR
jgi:hypothetical protein